MTFLDDPRLFCFTAAGLIAVLAACASRSAPSSYPADAPASRQAPEAQPAEVTRTLASDPPLPGESTAGWVGFAAAADGGPERDGAAADVASPGEQGHESHEGHHHHGAH